MRITPVILGLALLLPQLKASPARLVKDVEYRAGENLDSYSRERCKLDISSPAEGKNLPVIIWFHGGGLTKGDKKIPPQLLKHDIVIVAPNYRLTPQVKVTDCINDAAAAVAWVFANIASQGGDPDKIVVSGHSAGGYLASMVALDKSHMKKHRIDANRILGIVPFSGQTITHFSARKEMGMKETQPLINELAPLFHVRKDAPPMLLITGDRELELLGRYEENAYFWRMMKVVGHSDCQLHELGGFDHGEMAAPAFPLLVRFTLGHTSSKNILLPQQAKEPER
jgi:acetyl esterase/lipase